MKICTICNQTYRDDEQNYSLNDGSVLNKLNDDAPPTVFIDPPRVTNQTNWQNSAPVSAWENQTIQQNRAFNLPVLMQAQDKALPTISPILGVIEILPSACRFPSELCCFL